MASSEWLIQDILAKREVSLFGGPSGASKTTLLFQILQTWNSGDPVFGHASYPVPYAYISVDRSERSVRRTLERIGIDPDTINVLSAIDLKLTTLRSVINTARVKFSDAKAFFIDGFASLTPEGKINDYNTVANFLAEATRECGQFDLTIIGIVHAAKTRENEKYLNARQRILGSVAWAGFSDTIFYIEPTDAENATCLMRKFEILPRNAKNEVFELELTSTGTLILSTHKKEEDTSKSSMFLDNLASNVEFTPEGLQASLLVSRSTVKRIIEKWIDSDIIQRVRKGVYVKNWTV